MRLKLPIEQTAIRLSIRHWQKKLRYQFYACTDLLGVAGCVAITVLIFCVIFSVTTLIPMISQTEIGASKNSETTAAEIPPPQSEHDIAVANFLTLLPAQARPANLIGQLHLMGERTGVGLSNIDFQTLIDKETERPELPSIIVTLEINASHGLITQFINTVLKEMPYATLETFTLNRSKLSDQGFESQIRFRMSLRPK